MEALLAVLLVVDLLVDRLVVWLSQRADSQLKICPAGVSGVGMMVLAATGTYQLYLVFTGFAGSANKASTTSARPHTCDSAWATSTASTAT